MRRLAIAVTLVGSLLGCASGSSGAASGRGSAHADALPATCENWLRLSDDQHVVVVGGALEAKVGGAKSSEFAACLWSKGDEIVAGIVAGCTSGSRSYDDATGDAFGRAITSCRRP
jgi:hypothetical protein